MPRHTVSISRLPVSAPEAGPYAIAASPDDALWFTLVHAGEVARLTPDGGLDRYPLDPASCGPSVIAPGPDGALWFTRGQDHRIGRVTVTGEVSSFPVPTPRCGPFGITAATDGALWFTQTHADRAPAAAPADRRGRSARTPAPRTTVG